MAANHYSSRIRTLHDFQRSLHGNTLSAPFSGAGRMVALLAETHFTPEDHVDGVLQWVNSVAMAAIHAVQDGLFRAVIGSIYEEAVLFSDGYTSSPSVNCEHATSTFR